MINQKYSIRRLVTFFSSLILFFALLFVLFFKVAHAGAAEERYPKIIEAATSSKYSSATGHNYTVGGVKADNGKLVANVAQRVVVDGSAATVTQKVTIPANDAFYKKTAGYAKNLLKGGLYAAAAALAMKKLLDGVDYVMGEGGKIQRKQGSAVLDKYTSPYLYQSSDADGNLVTVYDINAHCSSLKYDDYNSSVSTYSWVFDSSSTAYPSTSCIYKRYIDGSYAPPNSGRSFQRFQNPNYNPSAPVPTPTPTDAEINDAFSNWFKNNSGSVTDPVTTYIYSPKNSDGSVNPNANAPSWGQAEITDEMMQNYIANRDAELYANDVAANQAAIRDSAQTETETKPDGTKTETKNNPDGSKTETKTETKTNPDTGEVTTTVTETVINPDGSRGPSKETETKTETKPNPETSKLPAACEYFAFLCEWTNWTKEKPELEDKQLEIEDIKVIDYKRENYVSFGSNCPFTPQMQSLPMGILGSIDFETDLTFICDFGHDAKPYVLGLGHLGALIFLLLGLRASGA